MITSALRSSLQNKFLFLDKWHGYFHVCYRETSTCWITHTYKYIKRGRRADPFRNNSKRKTSRIDNWHDEKEKRKKHAWQEKMHVLLHLTKSMNDNDDKWESVVQEKSQFHIYWLCKKTISFPTNFLTLHKI
jgi:hypothetical protein